MQISFIIPFMIDLYKDNHVCACVCAFVHFFFKKTSQKPLTGLLPNFIVVLEVKIFSSSLRKNQVCGAIQALKSLVFLAPLAIGQEA